MCTKCCATIWPMHLHMRPYRAVPGKKSQVNAFHDNGLCWCCGCCCDTTVFSGDHPFECEFCGSCFRDDGTLRGHKRIHTGEKPYECNGCGKRFSLKHQLETHYRVHTGGGSEMKTNIQESRVFIVLVLLLFNIWNWRTRKNLRIANLTQFNKWIPWKGNIPTMYWFY